MTTVLAVVFGGYALVMGAVAVRLARRPPPVESLPDDALPRLAVVVAARDEQDTLPRCLAALRAQDYPADRIEIVVADDHSTDGTAQIARAAEAADGLPVRYLRVSGGDGSLRGKAQAIHEGITTTTADAILITDADCAPVPTWARTVASALSAEGVGLVCAIAHVEARPGRLFDRVQALDLRVLLGAVAAFAEAGVTATGMGNNMGLRRAAYDAVGGYPALPFSVTEDFTLVRAVDRATPWAVRFVRDARADVWTLPVETVAQAYAQRRRWARGGLGGSAGVFAVYAGLFASHVALVAGLILAPLAGLGALAVKVACDGAVQAGVRRRTGSAVGLGSLLALEAFFVAYLVTLPFVLVLRPRIGWKGRRH